MMGICHLWLMPHHNNPPHKFAPPLIQVLKIRLTRPVGQQASGSVKKIHANHAVCLNSSIP